MLEGSLSAGFVVGCASLDGKDQAFEWLEKAYEERDGVLIFLKSEPYWDPLFDDPRCQNLLRRMNPAP
jgi:hypothetical protein